MSIRATVLSSPKIRNEHLRNYIDVLRRDDLLDVHGGETEKAASGGVVGADDE